LSSATRPDSAWSLRGLRIEAIALAIVAMLLAAVGIAMVYSASAELAIDVFSRQTTWFGLGCLVMIVGAAFDYRTWLRAAIPMYLLSIVLVGWVLFFGHSAGGARSWIGIGSLGGQPTDIVKFASAALLARYLASVRDRLDLAQLGVACLLLTPPLAIIALQPDMGGVLMICIVVTGMVLVTGVRLRALVVACLLGLVLGGSLWVFAPEYQRERIRTFVAPERDPLGSGYNLRQSRIAVGSGGVMGQGWLQGSQSQLRFLPARHTDFVFAVLAEEWGFLGTLAVFGLYGAYLTLGFRIATRARDRSGVLLATGLMTVFSAHLLYNTGMIIGLVPITGIPLPFLSYGGSFILYCFFATGTLISIDLRRYVNRA
jgi:rod shape determining protein RodA